MKNMKITIVILSVAQKMKNPSKLPYLDLSMKKTGNKDTCSR